MIIKVCGMRDPENIRKLSQLDINWMGMIFYPQSPRYILKDNNNFQFSILNSQLKKVGVFVNATLEEMKEAASQFKLDYLQLHGNESPDICYALQKRGYAIIKVFSVASIEDMEKTKAYEGRADYFLFDTKCNEYGGSGRLFDWSILHTYKGKTPFLLSGGIQPESIEAIRNFQHPQLAGIDLNSGFETAPAMKDIPLLSSFIQEIKKIK